MSATPLVASAKSGAASLWSSQSSWSQTLSRLTSSRRRQYPKLRISPSRILALRLRSKTDGQKKTYRHAFEFGAKQHADRLPLLLLQAWIARQNIQNEPDLSATIRTITPPEWSDRFHSLASRGWSKEDVDHWIWILSGEDGDVRVQRLISTEAPKPIFLVTFLVRSDETFHRAESLLSLMEYISKHHFHPKSPASNHNITIPSRKMTMTVSQFLILLRRLVNHVQRIWPRSIVTVARFTMDYIQRMPSESGTNSYRHKCEIFNTALQSFKRPAATQPLANREFNWRAQRLLLAMSDNLDKPFVINRASYRAVREVMVGLKKSQTEKAVAMRYAKSWPPYRQDFDGLDAKRTAEDDHSRSVKAGILAKDAGYPDDHYDQALDALGGMGANSPTVQTRSLPPKRWKGEKEDLNLYSHWAMLIRATRNRQEAWKVFNNVASKTGKAPNVQVYAEMFIKLQARQVPETSNALPGDSRESFPIHDANYSEYELARLSPPTVSELYDQMISRGVKPEGHCLHTLLANANSLEEGSRYLRDSGIDDASVDALALFKQPSYQAVREIPLLVFKSYIQLLCRLQPNRRGWQKIFPDELLRIRHAIKLTRVRLRQGTTEGSTFRPAWNIILRALARPHICVINSTPADNDAEALAISLDVLGSLEKTAGIDPDAFLYICRAVQKAAGSRLDSREFQLGGDAEEYPPLFPNAEAVAGRLKSIFSQIGRVVRTTEGGPGSLPAPKFMHSVGPAHLHTYMRTLAFLEDTAAMAGLLRWMLAHREYVNEEAERIEPRGHALVAKTLCAFEVFAGPALAREEHEDLAERLERGAETAGFWRWPTEEELETYVQSDLRFGTQRLRQRILDRLRARSSRQEGREMAAAVSEWCDVYVPRRRRYPSCDV
ncbi:hypothetical protein F4818DRAFT_273106 [Hypoxylon cercidicola]|nr:hypothetical protein F4818DRAFT_273106 [Hypoxylon cercidicola]